MRDSADNASDDGPSYDLDLVFGSDGEVRPIAAQDLFVNREAELHAFRAAYEAVHHPPIKKPVVDVRGPRENVIVYYGMGGMGKSRLARRCASTMQGSQGAIAAHMDMRDGSFLDPETFVLALRGAVARGGVSARAFDLGLAAYWATKHPGEDMPEFIRQSRGLRSVAGSAELHEQLAETIDSLLGIVTVAGATLRLGRKLVSALGTHVETKKLLASCPRLPEMLASEDPDHLRLYLPYLLAWDLDRKGRKPAQLTVFLDNFEDAQEVSRSRGDIEDAVCRAAYLMPNALFVITGRNHLSWGETASAGRLFFSGPSRWPQLAMTSGLASRQYLLGSLSGSDARKFLEKRLGSTPLSDETLGELTRAAEGWPLFLDIIATRIEQLRASAQQLEPGEFAGGFVEVVVRVMRDMDEDARDLLRVASLLPAVDGVALLAALPHVRPSTVRRFLGSPLLGREGEGRRINTALRESILRVDAHLDDGWDVSQWTQVATRLLDHLAARVDDDSHAGLSSTWFTALSLSARFALDPPWLPVLAELLFARGAWEVLRGGRYVAGIEHSFIGPVAVAAEAAAKRATGDTPGSMSALRDVAQQGIGALSQASRDYFNWQMAASAERMGDWQSAAEACDRIAIAPLRDRAIVRRGRLAWIADDLGTAENAASQVLQQLSDEATSRPEQVVAVEVTANNLLGWVLFTRGLMTAAREQFEVALRTADRSEDDFYISSELSHAALTACLDESPGADSIVDKALTAAEKVGAARQRAQARVALILLEGRTVHPEESVRRLGELISELETAGDALEVRLPLLAMTVLSARRDRLDLAEDAVHRMTAFAERHAAHYALRIAAAWSAGLPIGTARSVRWGEPTSTVETRWRALGIGRRS
jgi:hypothetical protein